WVTSSWGIENLAHPSRAPSRHWHAPNRTGVRPPAVPLSARRESYAERVDGPARPRIRWAWIAGCVVLGFSAIAAGRAIVLDADRSGYVAGVLGNVGTTLLLVGIVVLLERRIVDTAVRAVRNANDEARRAARDDFDAQMRDLEERIRTSWASGSVDAEAESRRISDEYSRRIVDVEGGDAERH
ncbi:MAG TPA: hypothetical protein VNT27_16865, partial [Propionibacteriaceae bacterium]|nr:hypothetical protein [Propionibacteriaceae bacterium]